MSTDDQLKIAHLTFIRASAVMANVIQSLEKDLERMKAKNVAQEFINSKDNDIQNLVNYYNQVDELVHFYRIQNINLKFQLSEMCEFIIKSADTDKMQQEYLMKYLNLNSNG